MSGMKLRVEVVAGQIGIGPALGRPAPSARSAECHHLLDVGGDGRLLLGGDAGAAATMRQFWIETSTPASFKVGASTPGDAPRRWTTPMHAQRARLDLRLRTR